MIVYPAIDLRGGVCVRLMHGRFDAVTRYDEDPAAQVDGGIDDHAARSRKLRRMRAPAAADRSGWNWQPQRLAARTTAGTGPP